MSELYKGQYENFKKVSEKLLNDPLGAIKHSLLDEEEKFNCMDEEHTPLLFFSIDTDTNQFDFCNIFGGITLRKTDNKIAMFYRYMYSNGSKKWVTMTGKNGSIWHKQTESIAMAKNKFLSAFERLGNTFTGLSPIKRLDFNENESAEDITNKLQTSDLVYIAKIDKKSKEINYINGEEKEK